MIYTVTLNPSVDYMVEMKDVRLGELNRTNGEMKVPGGKGINVSRVLNNMGVKSEVLGFAGGFTGTFIENYLRKENIPVQFVPVEGDSRINIKIKAQNETEINANGPIITDKDMCALKIKISKLTSSDLLVLAGSIPSTMPDTAYEEIVNICVKNNVPFVVDAEGELLKKVLPYGPLFIKPNQHELGSLFNAVISTWEEAIPYGRQLIEMGAKNVIVSLAGNGAVLITKEAAFWATVPKGQAVNSVGAGDSMVAGFLAATEKGEDLAAAFRYSIASGSATAFSMGLCTKEMADKLLSEVSIFTYEK